MRPESGENRTFTAAARVLLVIFAVVSVYPFFWMCMSALKETREIFLSPTSLPSRIDLRLFARTWQTANLGMAFFNSLLSTAVAVSVVVLTSSFAAFALARMRFRGKRLLLGVFVSGQIVSAQIVLVPLFALYIRLQWFDTLASLVSACIAFGIGLGVLAWAGIGNFRRLFADPVFWHSLKNTLIWVVMSGTVLSVSGLLLAFLVEYGTKAKWLSSISRTVLFMPMMMSLVSVGLLWTLIYNPMLGLLSNLLSALHLADKANPLDFLGTPKAALYFAFVPAIWQWSGFGMVVFSAALQGIPQELFDASAIDGASTARQLRHITLPLLYPAIAGEAFVRACGAPLVRIACSLAD